MEDRIFAPAPLCVSRIDQQREVIEVVRIGEDVQVYKIDGVSAFVWQQLDGKTKMGTVVTRVLKEFEVSAAKAKKDLSELVEQLLSLGLLQER